MNVFNDTLTTDIEDSGLVNVASKSLYPIAIPQQPSDFRDGGPALADWLSPPVQAQYLAFGYAALLNSQIVLAGWLFDTRQANVTSAQVIDKRYFGAIDEAGARRIAHEFAADIIAKFGGESLLDSHIYFVSDRTGHKEIWSMEPDGANQKQITHYNSITTMPAVSADGTKLAFTTWAEGPPKIFVISLENGRRLPFANPKTAARSTPTNTALSFAPDGKHVLYSSSISGWQNIYSSDLDGGNSQELSSARRIDTEPKPNPKTGNDIVFVSAIPPRAAQIWKMSLDGTNREMLTTGEGYASNPAWHPNGDVIAFAWTGGLARGDYNIFVMDVASRKFDQLTHGSAANENPAWGPDGRHLAFGSKRGGKIKFFPFSPQGTGWGQLNPTRGNRKSGWGK